MGILIENRNFGRKMGILVENKNFGRRMGILIENRNFGSISKLWSKIKILVQNLRENSSILVFDQNIFFKWQP